MRDAIATGSGGHKGGVVPSPLGANTATPAWGGRARLLGAAVLTLMMAGGLVGADAQSISTPPSSQPQGSKAHPISVVQGAPLNMLTPQTMTLPSMGLDIQTPRLATGDDIRRAVADINKVKKGEDEKRKEAEAALRASIGFHQGDAGAPAPNGSRQQGAAVAPAGQRGAGQPPPLPCQDEHGDMAMLSQNCMREMGVIQTANIPISTAPRGSVSAEGLPAMSAGGVHAEGAQCIVSIFTKSGGVPPTNFTTRDARECLAAATHMNYGVPGTSNITIIGDGLGIVEVSCNRPPPDGTQIECVKQ